MITGFGYNSPRAQTLLFMFLRPQGLMIVSIVEMSQEFKNPLLTKICPDVFLQFDFKVGYRQCHFGAHFSLVKSGQLY